MNECFEMQPLLVHTEFLMLHNKTRRTTIQKISRHVTKSDIQCVRKAYKCLEAVELIYANILYELTTSLKTEHIKT